MKSPISLLIEAINAGASVSIEGNVFDGIIISDNAVRFERNDEGLVLEIEVNADTLTILPDGSFSFQDQDGDITIATITPFSDPSVPQDRITNALLEIAKAGGLTGVKAALRMAVVNFAIEFKNPGEAESLPDPDEALLEELADAILTPAFLQG